MNKLRSSELCCMGTNGDNGNWPKKEQLQMYRDAMKNEIQLHWKRNSYFLLSSSILLIVLGLLKDEFFHLILGILGVTLNIVWLFIQHRSSKYIGHWKDEIARLTKEVKDFNIYPKGITRIEMRHLGYVLPCPFILIWVAVIIIAAHPDYSIVDSVTSLMPNTTK